MGLEARRRDLVVVSAPLARDQVYRKTPLLDPPVSHRALVFSPLAARFLARAGVPPSLFECVSGTASEKPEPASLRDVLGLPEQTRIVLFASQGQAANAILLPMLAARAAALPGVALVIRPHPNEWAPLVRLVNRGVHVSAALTARQAIRAADVVVTHSSFMAVEAALLGCPVVLVSAEPVPSLLPLITEGLARWVWTSVDLDRALLDILGQGDEVLASAQARFRNEQEEVGDCVRAAQVVATLAGPPS